MKKLLLTALAIVGLAGSSVQGAAAAAAGFAAKAGAFLQKAALPALVGQVMYDVHGYLHPQAAQADLTGVHTKIDAIGSGFNALAGAINPVINLPFVQNALADATQAPSTWYGSVWKNLMKADALSDTVLSKVQKIMYILSLFVGKQAYAHAQAANVQPQAEQQAQENVTAGQPVQPVMFKKRRHHRRSGIAARA